jgi:hypothetical protein
MLQFSLKSGHTAFQTDGLLPSSISVSDARLQWQLDPLCQQTMVLVAPWRQQCASNAHCWHQQCTFEEWRTCLGCPAGAASVGAASVPV